MPASVAESAAVEESLSQDCLSHARAYLVTRSLIVWNADEDVTSVWLYASRKAQLFITSEGVEVNGKCKNASGLQLPDVLDDMFAYSGPLGAVFSEDAITLYLWAPTTQI